MSTLTFDAEQWPRKGSAFEKIQDAKGLALLMMEKAQEQFAKKGSQSTDVLLVTEDTIHAIHMPLSSQENERIAGGNLVQKLAHDHGAVGLAFASEAWLIPGAKEADLANQAKLLAREDKLEILLIRASWDGQEPGAKAVQIVREGRKARLVERPDLFTPDGVDGVMLLKKKDEGAISKQILRTGIPI